MIVGTQIQSDKDIEPMLEFYKSHFATVELVRCDKCKEFLAFELSGGDGMGMQPNEIGKFVVAIGDQLLSHRARLDEAPTGERMMGYQCACGNDTRVADIERGKVPVGLNQVSLSPFEKHRISEAIKSDKKHKPKFKKVGNKKHFETFSVERIQ